MSIEVIYNEKNLLYRIAEGDRAAFREFYGHYLKVVEGHVAIFGLSREVLNDLTQDIFVKIWEKRERLATVESFKNYLFIVSRNTVFNYFRSMKMQQQTRELDETMDATPVHYAEHAILYKQYYHIAVEGMEKLTPRRREILKMRIERGLTLDEIAAELNISRPGVKKQLYEAMAFVRQYLLEHAEISILFFAFLTLFEI